MINTATGGSGLPMAMLSLPLYKQKTSWSDSQVKDASWGEWDGGLV